MKISYKRRKFRIKFHPLMSNKEVSLSFLLTLFSGSCLLFLHFTFFSDFSLFSGSCLFFLHFTFFLGLFSFFSGSYLFFLHFTLFSNFLFFFWLALIFYPTISSSVIFSVPCILSYFFPYVCNFYPPPLQPNTEVIEQLKYYCGKQPAAKRVWKNAVEQHTFFRSLHTIT